MYCQVSPIGSSLETAFWFAQVESEGFPFVLLCCLLEFYALESFLGHFFFIPSPFRVPARREIIRAEAYLISLR